LLLLLLLLLLTGLQPKWSQQLAEVAQGLFLSIMIIVYWMSLFLDPPVLLVVARIVTTSLVFSMNVDVVVVEDAIFMMAVVIASVMAIEYDNIDRVTSAGK
jgi:hypothetical protein